MVRDAKSTDRMPPSNHVGVDQEHEGRDRKAVKRGKRSSRSKHGSSWYGSYLAILEQQPWYGNLECIAFGTLFPSVSCAIQHSRRRSEEERKENQNLYSNCRGALVLTSHMLYAVLFLDSLGNASKSLKPKKSRSSPSFAVLVEEMVESFVFLRAIRVLSQNGNSRSNNPSSGDGDASASLVGDGRGDDLILSLATWDRHCCLGDDLVFSITPSVQPRPPPVVFFEKSKGTSALGGDSWERTALAVLEATLGIDSELGTDEEHEIPAESELKEQGGQQEGIDVWPFNRLPLQLVPAGADPSNSSQNDDESTDQDEDDNNDDSDDNESSEEDDYAAAAAQISELTHAQQRTELEKEEDHVRHWLHMKEGQELLDVWYVHVAALQELWSKQMVEKQSSADVTTTAAKEGEEGKEENKDAEAEARAQVRTNITDTSVTLAPNKGIDQLPLDDPYRRRHEAAIAASGFDQLDEEGIQQAKRILEEEERTVRLKMHRFLSVSRGN